VPTEPDDITVLLTSVGGEYVRVGIEAGPLSQWLVNGLAGAGSQSCASRHGIWRRC
jgi:transposase